MAGARAEITIENWTFPMTIADHVVEKRNEVLPKLNRILRILKKTTERNFDPEDYADEEALKSCDAGYNKRKKSTRDFLFSEFLREWRKKECQLLFFEFFSFLGWDEADVIAAAGHLTHFNCLKEYGKQPGDPPAEKQHSRQCLQKPQLKKWQLRWFQQHQDVREAVVEEELEEVDESVEEEGSDEDEEEEAAGYQDNNNNNNENEEKVDEEEVAEVEEVNSEEDEEEVGNDGQSPDLETDDHAEEVRTVSDDSPHFFNDLSVRQMNSPNITLLKIELGQTRSSQWGQDERGNLLRLIKDFPNLVKIEIDSNYFNVFASAMAFPPPTVSATQDEVSFPTVKVLKVNQVPIPIGFLSWLPNLEALEFTPRISGKAFGRGWTDPVVSDYNPTTHVLPSLKNHKLTSVPESDIWHVAPSLKSIVISGNQGGCDEEYIRDGNLIRHKFIKRRE